MLKRWLSSATRRLLLPALLLPATGCILVVPVATGGVGATAGALSAPLPPDTTASPYAVGAAIRVDFADITPRVARDANGGSLAVGSLRTAFGRVASTRGDSLWLRLSEIHDDRGRVRHFAGARAPVLPVGAQADGTVRVLALVPRMRERALVGAGVGFVAGLLAMIGICARYECFG